MKTILPIVPCVAAFIVCAKLATAQTTPATVTPAPPAATIVKRADRLQNVVYAMQTSPAARDAVPPLILQFSSSDQNAYAALEEDLTVMTRLLEKSLEQSLGENSPAFKMGIPMLVTSSGRSVRAMYLDGFGATFMVKVNFPVLAPPATEEKKAEPKSDDSEWERTRKELQGIQEPTDSPANAGAEIAYDPALVETLKKSLLETLRNASNIRGLKPEDFVCVTVFGGPNATTLARPSAFDSAPSKTPAASRWLAANTPSETSVSGRRSSAANYFSTHEGQGTVLTLRVKKSDVDAFARDTLDLKAFQKAATFNAYVGSGHDVTSINSWSRPGTPPRSVLRR